MTFQCPVCGYSDLPRPALDDLICACCGTHFGYHDYGSSYEALRSDWVTKGAPWFSRSIKAPNGWDPMKQLAKARMLLWIGGSTDVNEIEEINLSPNDMRAWSLAAPLAA